MAPSEEGKTVLSVITGMYDKISQAEKKIADFILNHIDDAVNSNVSELANHSGVSDATVIRFCKHLGYDGYYQMRLCLSRDIGRSQISSDGRLPAGADSHGLFRMIADTAVAAAATIDNETLKTVVNLILNCDTVHLVAAGNTTSLCMYFGPRLEKLGIRCTYSLLPEQYLGHIDLSRKDEIVLAISGSGTSRYVVKALELAKEKHLRTVAITEFQFSPVSRIADYLLLSAPGSNGENPVAQTSRLGEMFVLEVLYQMLEYAMSNKSSLISEPEMLLSESKL